MDSSSQIEEMARKYKEEMLRMYKKNGSAIENKAAEFPPPSTKNVENEPQGFTEKSEPKFLSPDEIIRQELNDNHEKQENFQGNYSSEIFSNEAAPLEPRFSGDASPSPDESGVGYITAEVTTGGGAVPIENAAVLITKKKGGKNYLLKMLVTDESGSTATVALPAPNASFSETPEPSEKPYADYYLSVYADGYYAQGDREVPVFSGVKSIQPLALIPKANDDTRFSLD